MTKITTAYDSDKKNFTLAIDGEVVNNLRGFICDKFTDFEGNKLAVITVVREDREDNGDVNRITMSWTYKIDDDSSTAFEITREAINANKRAEKLFDIAGITND